MLNIKLNINASLLYHVLKLADTWRKNGERLTEQYGITTQQWIILLFLANDPNIIYLQQNPKPKPMMAMELAEALQVSRANITNMINVLLAKKLIVQVEDEEDRRCKRLMLSPQGEQVVAALEPVRHVNNERQFALFSDDEKLNFIKFISTCLQTMNGHDAGEMVG
jgi:DNA-binding MarR family transcriptional regulator